MSYIEAIACPKTGNEKLGSGATYAGIAGLVALAYFKQNKVFPYALGAGVTAIWGIQRLALRNCSDKTSPITKEAVANKPDLLKELFKDKKVLATALKDDGVLTAVMSSKQARGRNKTFYEDLFKDEGALEAILNDVEALNTVIGLATVQEALKKNQEFVRTLFKDVNVLAAALEDDEAFGAVISSGRVQDQIKTFYKQLFKDEKALTTALNNNEALNTVIGLATVQEAVLGSDNAVEKVANSDSLMAKLFSSVPFLNKVAQNSNAARTVIESVDNEDGGFTELLNSKLPKDNSDKPSTTETADEEGEEESY